MLFSIEATVAKLFSLVLTTLHHHSGLSLSVIKFYVKQIPQRYTKKQWSTFSQKLKKEERMCDVWTYSGLRKNNHHSLKH